MVEIGRYREVTLPQRFAGASLPEMRAIDLTQDPPPRGRWLAPTLVQELEANLAARRAVAAVPQPPRLRSADPVPPLRPPLPMPQLHRVDGRAPADAPPRLPPLRPCDAAAQGLPRMRRGGQPGRLRPGRRAHRRRGRRAVPRRAHRDRHLRHHLVPRQGRRVRRGDGGRRDRHRHRHPARHQGLSLPQPDVGRCGRRRSRALRRRPPRGRAQLPADPAGRRPRRPRRQARAGCSSRPTNPRRR